jgi:hypothetical protein
MPYRRRKVKGEREEELTQSCTEDHRVAQRDFSVNFPFMGSMGKCVGKGVAKPGN